MPVKVIMLFNGTTDPAANSPSIGYRGGSHGYGYTENFYLPSNNAAALANMATILQRRSALLPNETRLIGVRLYQWPDGGLAQVLPTQYGTGNYVTDAPQISILCSTQLPNSKTQRRWWIHNIPDAMVIGGEFVPTNPYRDAVLAYFTALQNALWPQEQFTNYTGVHDVTQTGLVTFSAASPFGVGQYVRIVRTTDSSGKRRGGTFRVTSVGPGADQVTVAGWTYGATTGGHSYVSSHQLVGFWSGTASGPVVSRAGERKVGRPTELYHGRRSRHH